MTVEIDAGGKLVAIKQSDRTLPAHVRATVEEITFLPALENGDPIASTLTLNPSQFFKE